MQCSSAPAAASCNDVTSSCLYRVCGCNHLQSVWGIAPAAASCSRGRRTRAGARAGGARRQAHVLLCTMCVRCMCIRCVHCVGVLGLGGACKGAMGCRTMFCSVGGRLCVAGGPLSLPQVEEGVVASLCHCVRWKERTWCLLWRRCVIVGEEGVERAMRHAHGTRPRPGAHVCARTSNVEAAWKPSGI